jgi:hypothetical protein
VGYLISAKSLLTCIYCRVKRFRLKEAWVHR